MDRPYLFNFLLNVPCFKKLEIDLFQKHISTERSSGVNMWVVDSGVLVRMLHSVLRQNRWLITRGGRGFLEKRSERMSGSKTGCGSLTTTHTRTGNNSKGKRVPKERISLYLLRIPFHCMSNVWRKDRREGQKWKDWVFPSIVY